LQVITAIENFQTFYNIKNLIFILYNNLVLPGLIHLLLQDADFFGQSFDLFVVRQGQRNQIVAAQVSVKIWNGKNASISKDLERKKMRQI
jgi:hypothetical protein